MSRSSLFRRVTRYVPSAGIDPGEDRLTEITAGVLERVDGLARHLALRWLDASRVATSERASSSTAAGWARVAALPETSAVSVRTQVPSEARRVDLELRFHEHGRTSPTAAVLWVEVKHGTDPHTGQLRDYVQARPHHPGGVVLLAPRHDLPAPVDQCPEVVPERSWQATAADAASFRANNDVDRWLIAEWLAYLREERLMDLEALGPEHLTALAYGAEARAALDVVVEEASRVIVAARGEPSDFRRRQSKPAYGIGYWETWAVTTATATADPWDGAWLDWKLDESRGGGVGVPAGRIYVMAGLSKPRDHEFTSPHPGWLDGLTSGSVHAAERIVFRRWRGEHERLQRVAYPQEILRGPSLEEQGASLGRWVVATFAAIEEHGPPLAS